MWKMTRADEEVLLWSPRFVRGSEGASLLSDDEDLVDITNMLEEEDVEEEEEMRRRRRKVWCGKIRVVAVSLVLLALVLAVMMFLFKRRPWLRELDLLDGPTPDPAAANDTLSCWNFSMK